MSSSSKKARGAGSVKSSRAGALTFVVPAALIAIAIVVATVLAIRQTTTQREEAAGVFAGDDPQVEGLTFVDDLSQNHVEGEVDYEQTPAVGGDHNAVWLNCGVYEEPVPDELAVHSLEHGAVWLAHAPDADADVREALGEIADGNGYVLVSPVEGLDAPVVASAWGVQLELDDAEDPKLEGFVTQFAQGPQTPEPGAPCTGGVDL
ncbi:DUF3105 domain-containing protein [Nocardioides perillae]|uniref:DUF3105 domain-containing protein n=1 Tax=Nocardioides perillae TaxID=1119534 RepID=A0A7Y9RUZ2_9ACTN|nr:hypothetical protein [Nocardioides perillae]